MSENKRSYFSTIPGLVTGLAGVLTAIVGLITVLIQLDVIGGDDSDGVTAVNAGPTTSAAPAGGGATGTTAITAAGRLAAEPTLLKLQGTERDKAVTVRNASSAATITVLKPELSGADRAVFTTDAGCTNVTLRPGASCTVKVLLAPSGALRTYNANLVLKASEILAVTEVPIQASIII